MKLLGLASGLNAFSVNFNSNSQHDFQLEFDSGANVGSYLLHNRDIFIHSNGIKYSAADGNLSLISSSTLAGDDKLGANTMYIQKWEYEDGKRFNSVIKSYEGQDLVIFEQHFVDGIDDSSVGRKDVATSGFPVFEVNNEDDDIGFVTPGGNCMGWTKMAAGKYKLDEIRVKPLDGRFVADRNGGIVMLFGGDSHEPDSVIMSPFNNFMVQHNVMDLEEGNLYYGVQGGAKEIPAGYIASTIVQGSADGVREAIYSWGENLRNWYDRHQHFRNSDIFVTHLGYNTNAGAYYYYNREGDLNYDETMAFAARTFEENNIPIAWMQYDSWFYAKGKGNGVTYWYPRDGKDYFPDGAHQAFQNHGHILQTHNRWWAPDNVYAKQNGGEYDFIIEPDGVEISGPITIEGPNGRPIEILDGQSYKKGPFAIPNDDKFWMDFFKDVKTWGVNSYLQDWMMDQYLLMNATQESATLARDWLINMGEAADAYDLNIQYCLTLTRCGMQALEIPRVTMARATADYAYNFAQWTIGITGMITDVLGIAPHKDTFYTVPEMPDNGLGWPENHSDMHCAIATLTTGPVTFGDKPGLENRDLLMKCCRDDGKILKPDRAISAIDSQIRNLAIDIEHGPGTTPFFNDTIAEDRWNVQGQVWTTYSHVGIYEYGIVFGGSLIEDYQLYQRETGFADRPVLAFKGYPNLEILGTNPWPMTISSSEKFGLYYTSEIISVGNGEEIALIGDLSKWVPMSSHRVSKVVNYFEFLLIELDGVVGEKVNFFYAHRRSSSEEFQIQIAEVEFGSSLRATIRIQNGRPTVTY